jgi:outer membrane protein assembly factor BamB
MNRLLSRGSVLVYLVVLVLIFGILGVIIASLFTVSTYSATDPNEIRRVNYLTESGIRYAFSELRNSDFDTNVIDTLNGTTYTVSTAGEFEFNIFGPWFDADETKDMPGDGVTLRLKVPEGELTSGWMAKNPGGLWALNFDFITLVPTASSEIVSWEQNDDYTLTITLADDFIINAGERVCLAVKPTADQSVSDGGDFNVAEEAKDFFPENDGSININRKDYVYKRMVHDPDNGWVKLEGFSDSAMPNSESPTYPLDLLAADFIVLSPRNHIVIPTGTLDEVAMEGTLDNALNIYDLATVKPMTGNPDIDFNRETLSTALNQNETDPGFIGIDDSEKTIDIGGGEALKDSAEFGSVWFDANNPIGGKQDVCQAGACEFGRGVRIFFTMDYKGPSSGLTADGLTFALINAADNTTDSSGGDVAMGELLAYGGDSRTLSDPSDASHFLDGSGDGLRPPKMALEFDTYTNNARLEYCNGTSLVASNRNDPFSGNQDAVQYVFWGLNSLTIPCRDYRIYPASWVTDHPTYDDNQHDVGELEQPWTAFPTSGAVRSTPAIADDGTIYVGSDDGHLYAINPEDGFAKWTFPSSGSIGAVRSTPVIGTGDTVYFGSDDGKIYAVNPVNGSQLWSYEIESDTPVRSPVIGEAGKVYVGADNGKFYGFDAFLQYKWEFPAAGPLSFGRPAVSPDGIIYVSNRIESGSNGYWVYALNPDQRELDPTGTGFVSGANGEWRYNIGGGSQYMPGRDPATGTIYSDASSDRIVAITPGGFLDWQFSLGADVDSTPVVGSDGTVYFGSSHWSDGDLYAINPGDRSIGSGFPVSGREWKFSIGNPVETTPAIAPDGTILVVSDNDTLYAVNPNGTEKWTFPIPVDGNAPTSSPTVGNEGVVYVGSSSNNKLYAINDFAVPRNFKDKVITAVNDGTDTRVAGEIVTVDDDLDWLEGDTSTPDTKGPWAIRLEVMRSLAPNASSNYEYTLHTWIRQCYSVTCGNILGTFYEDTRIEYAADPHLDQTIELTASEHTKFNRFLFGFTGSTGVGTAQRAIIAKFKLSFIRPNDPVASD